MIARRRIYLLVSALAIMLTLTACGVGTTGAPAPTEQALAITATAPLDGVPPTQPTMGNEDSSVSTTTTTAHPTSTPGTEPSQDSRVRDQASLIDALRASGATVEIQGSVEQPFLSVSGTEVRVNTAAVQVFEYADEPAAQTDAAQAADILAGKGTTMIDWVAAPHFYRAGRVLILYVGDDSATLALLRNVVGAPFAEQ